jgi:hypothetical protein
MIALGLGIGFAVGLMIGAVTMAVAILFTADEESGIDWEEKV